MEAAVATSKIASPSSGEFVLLVADDPNNNIYRKAFLCGSINDHDALKAEEDDYHPMTEVRKITLIMVQRNYYKL